MEACAGYECAPLVSGRFVSKTYLKFYKIFYRNIYERLAKDYREVIKFKIEKQNRKMFQDGG